MTQTADAFARVEGALTFFITYYNSLAGFKSVVDRLTSFDEAIERAKALGTTGPDADRRGAAATLRSRSRISASPCRTAGASSRPRSLALAAGESVLLAGPSGSGKSTLFRAISGIWPYGEGRIRIPEGADVMVVPQKPYIPIGTLRAAVTYPAAADTYSDEEIRQALVDARLGILAEPARSRGDRGRSASRAASSSASRWRARCCTQPDWLFLDESTSALDEKLEAELYRHARRAAAQNHHRLHRPSLDAGAPSTRGAST